MAEVFIAQTRPEIIDENWPPKPAEPFRSDAPKDFVPAPQPISNSDSAVIAHGPPPLPQQPGAPAPLPISIGSVESYATPNHGPISNERGAGTIMGEPPPWASLRHNNMPPPPAPISTNLEVRFTPGPAPVENNPNRHIAHAPPRIDGLPPPAHQVPHTPTPAPQGGEPEFIRTGQPGVAPAQLGATLQVNHDSYVPPPPTFSSAPVPRPAGGVINVGGGDVQILPGTTPPVANSDTTIGGGGWMHRHARQEEVSIAGQGAQSPLNIGSSDVQMAPSGDTTRQAGVEDKTFAGAAGMLGNQEAFAGAQGEPIANKDLQDMSFGGVGKPKNVKG